MAYRITRKKGGSVDKALAGLKALNKDAVEVGHFKAQGLHSDSELTYPELLMIWAFGLAPGNEGVARDPRSAFTFREMLAGKLSQDPDIINLFNKWDPTKKGSERSLLDKIGRLLRTKYKRIFGVVGPMMPPDSTNTPMFETGELQAHVAYKLKSRNTIQEE